MKYTVSVEKTFSSAHALRGYKGKCERLHGHNWKVKVSICGNKLNKVGMLVDFADVKVIIEKILARLDHQYLNEIPPFDKTNPTAENIAAYIFSEAKSEVDTLKLKVIQVEVWESETSSAAVRE